MITTLGVEQSTLLEWQLKSISIIITFAAVLLVNRFLAINHFYCTRFISFYIPQRKRLHV